LASRRRERDLATNRGDRYGVGRLPAGLDRLRWHIWAALLALAALVTIGVVYYGVFEPRFSGTPWTPVDAFYMVTLTLSTVGLREVHPLSSPGKVFTALFILVGVLTAAFGVRSAAELLVGQQVWDVWGRRRRWRVLKQMANHYVVCGYGRMGREIVRQLQRHHVPVAVIEQDDDTVRELQEAEIPLVHGNATHDESLLAAGLERAKGLIAVADSDEDNLFITLSARVLNPRLYIVARVSQDSVVEKLRRAGADRVLSPYVIGGRQIAAAIIRPGLVDYLEKVLHSETAQVEMDAVVIAEGSAAAGRTLADPDISPEGGPLVVAVQSHRGKIEAHPAPHMVLEAGDCLVAMGTPEQLERLRRLAASEEQTVRP